ncbi:MAG: hypothetical protein LBD01_05100 [Puniceicoccales bacterium]|jgi:hypothetical protein|nr:hypothetical protein [Puniceicoccales bacterium]
MPTGLSSAELERLEVAVRERAFFSAKVSDARLLSEMKEKIQRALDMPADAPIQDRARFVRDVRRELSAMQGDSGNLTDIESARRLKLIFDMNIESAYSRARYARESADPDVLDAFPCQELVRIERRENPRDWKPRRWQAAGGELYADRMVARKDDPVWGDLSRFGTPWPPFDFGSGMGVRNVSRKEAVALGVIGPKDTVEPPGVDDILRNDFAEEFRALDIDPETKDALAASLPPSILDQLGTPGAEAAFRRGKPESITSD